jgi:CRISPR-associated protein Cas1
MKKRNYYILSDGKLRRKENTLYFVSEKGEKPIPINSVYSIYAKGSLSITSKALALLSKEGVCIHFFNRYGFYEGSYYPRENLISGEVVVRQAEHYLDNTKRFFLAKAFVEGAILNMEKILAGYGLDTSELISALQSLASAESVQEIMGSEAFAKNTYYSFFDTILKRFEFKARMKRPPGNEINALISFGNSMLYSAIISELYHTQLHPAISFLHEPAERRFSLSLDIAEIFKPIIVDRLIFNLVNKGIIKENDFDRSLNGILLNDTGRKKFVKAFNERMESTIKHRQLKRKVSYQRLIRLECYKLVKHILGVEKFRPFVMWW